MCTGLIPDLSNPSSKLISTISTIAFALFVVPHQLATYVRVYDTKATSRSMGKRVAILGIFCLLLGTLAGTSPFWASVIGRITFCFSFQHFYAQAYGIALIYCYKRQYFFQPWEKRILFLLIQSGVWLGIVRTVSGPELSMVGTKLIKLLPTFPNWVCPGITAILIALAVVFSFIVLRKWIVNRQLLPLPAALTIMTAFFLFAYLPGIPQIAGSLLVLYLIGHSFFHTPQYLVITSAFHIKDRGLPVETGPSNIASMLFKPVAIKYFVFLYSTAILIIAAAEIALPKIGAAGIGLQPELMFLAYVCAINLHHY